MSVAGKDNAIKVCLDVYIDDIRIEINFQVRRMIIVNEM